MGKGGEMKSWQQELLDFLTENGRYLPCPNAHEWIATQDTPQEAWKSCPWPMWRGWLLRRFDYFGTGWLADEDWVREGRRTASVFGHLTHEEQLELIPEWPL